MKLSSPASRAGTKELFVAFWIFIAALAIAAALRTPQLSVRPMHTDETTQAIKFRDLTNARYEYDPFEHHGPTLLYATIPSTWGKSGSFADLTEENLRLVPVVFSIGLILLLPLLGGGLGKLSVAWACLFMAVSPLFVFYSRYYIMEMLLAFFSFTTIACGWRFYLSRNPFWLVTCAASVGLMHATKETFIIHVIGMIGGIVVAGIFKHAMGGGQVLNRNKPAAITKRHWVTFLVVTALVSMLCFSQGFSHLSSIADSVKTYFNYADRAGGQGHQKPWYYYLQLLGWNSGGKFWQGESGGPFVWTELFILGLAVLGMLRTFFGRAKTWSRELGLFLTAYTVLTFGAYSFIAYKTPWCILSTHVGLILLAGLGAGALIESLYAGWAKWACAGLLFVGAGHLALQSYRSNFQDDPTSATWLRTRNTHSNLANPYAYGFTPMSTRDSIVSKLEGYAKASPLGKGLHIEIGTPSGSWPLPWYLRKFTNVAYLPAVKASNGVRSLDESADVILVDPNLTMDLSESVRGADTTGSATYVKDIFGLINQQFWIQGYAKRSLVPNLPPMVAPEAPAKVESETTPAPAPTPSPAPAAEAPTPPASAENGPAQSLPEPPFVSSPLPDAAPVPAPIPAPAPAPKPITVDF